MKPIVEIVETIGTGPIRFLPDKSCKIQLGMIVELVEIAGNPSCTISDGSKPFGIVTEIDGPFGMVSIYFDTMVLRTRRFDTDCSYNPGDLVYSNLYGAVTTQKPHPNAHLLGHVISGLSKTADFVEINWI